MNKSLIALLACAVALAGCTQPTAPAPPTGDGGNADDGDAPVNGDDGTDPVHAATFTADEYSFSGPATVSAGWVTFTMNNVGAEWHEMVLLPLPEGKTLADFQALLAADQAAHENGTEMDANATAEEDFEERPPVGGIGAVVGGVEATATFKVDEGSYILACWVPSPDGTPHAFKGMLGTLNVTAAAANAEPTGADVTITVADGEATIAPEFTAGEHTVKAVNAGSDPEEDYTGLQFVKLSDNVTGADFIAHIEAGPNATGPPPGLPWGGLTSLPAATTIYFDVDLVAGNYAILSFDREIRVVAEFTVEAAAGDQLPDGSGGEDDVLDDANATSE